VAAAKRTELRRCPSSKEEMRNERDQSKKQKQMDHSADHVKYDEGKNPANQQRESNQ
jgi:hypothetical protein